MATERKGRKSLNFFMCESTYSAIAVNLHKHKSTRQAILWFIDHSDTFKSLASGDLHNKMIDSCERNTADKLLDYKKYNEEIKAGVIHKDEYTQMRKAIAEDIPDYPKLHDIEDKKKYMIENDIYCYEADSGEPFTKEDVEKFKVERDRIILEIGRVKPTDDQGDTSTGFSDKAYKQIWRMCETYEKYCIETKQPGPLPLNIVKNN
tara:strand:- start:41 stop:658 length:618 start_codon:yes stop_codon:yes gene_type:complete